jgi:hypothetical protein
MGRPAEIEQSAISHQHSAKPGRRRLTRIKREFEAAAACAGSLFPCRNVKTLY